MSVTRTSRVIAAPRERVYDALVELVPGELVVEADEFETDPAMQGEMLITIRLTDAPAGTELVATHEGLPHGVSAEANETGWRESLTRLAALVE